MIEESFLEKMLGPSADTQRIAELEARAELAEAHLQAREALLSELEWGNCQRKAEADVARLRAALEKVEWVINPYQDGECPWCEGIEEDGGHKPDCQRQAALRTDEHPPESERE